MNVDVKKGDLLKIGFGPAEGHEQDGYRPALVVSGTLFNAATGFVWALPITSRVKGRPDEIALPAGLPVSGVILFSQIKTLDLTSRPYTKIGAVPDEFMDMEVSGRLIAVLEDA